MVSQTSFPASLSLNFSYMIENFKWCLENPKFSILLTRTISNLENRQNYVCNLNKIEEVLIRNKKLLKKIINK